MTSHKIQTRGKQLTTPPQQLTFDFPIPDGFHAFMRAVACIYDSGVGDSMDIQFPDGTMLRVKASAEVLRLNPTGHHWWVCTLHFRTLSNGVLFEPLHLQRIEPLESVQKVVHQSRWSAVGQVTKVDPIQPMVTIRVYPEQARATPFLISAYLSLEQVLPSKNKFIHLVGSLNQKRLVVEVLTSRTLEIPERWHNWKAN
jgi:hypothetical protein